MSYQKQLDDQLERLSSQYQKFNADQVKFAIKEIDRVRLELADLLSEYSNSDGIIKKQRLSKLLRELETIEKAVRANGMDAMQSVISETVDFTTNSVANTLVTVLGQPAIANASFDNINKNVFRYVVNREGEDGLILSDRVWNFAGDQRDQLSKVLRSGIIKGESTSALITKVRKVYDNDTWKIKRMVVTEGNMAYRTAVSYSGQQSKVVDALHIHHGKADRPEHRCTQLEQADDYGLGAGNYPPSASEIYNPHPNCTSYLTYVLNPKYL